MQTILLVGMDRALLSSRAAVLRHTGAETVTAELPEALAIAAERSIDVVVLCHTLPEVVCGPLTRRFRERSPSMRVLRVLESGREATENAGELADAISPALPECLLKTALALMRERLVPPVQISEWKASLPITEAGQERAGVQRS